jgi:hypothetical protein
VLVYSTDDFALPSTRGAFHLPQGLGNGFTATVMRQSSHTNLRGLDLESLKVSHRPHTSSDNASTQWQTARPAINGKSTMDNSAGRTGPAFKKSCGQHWKGMSSPAGMHGRSSKSSGPYLSTLYTPDAVNVWEFPIKQSIHSELDRSAVPRRLTRYRSTPIAVRHTNPAHSCTHSSRSHLPPTRPFPW